jgi:hypothetical protein
MADTPHTPPGPPEANKPPVSGGHDHGHGPTPMGNLWMAMTGASAAGHHHEEVPGVDAQAAKVGHEPDQFNARTIVYVPVVVAITLVVTYLIVQGAFAFVNGKEAQQKVEETTDSTDPAVIARIQKENETRVKDWNDRSARIRNWQADPLAKSTPGEQTLPAVPQPQLEYNRQVDLTRKDANGNVVTDPPFVRSFRPTAVQAKRNAPEIYPESLRPENFIDPDTETKLLGESAWVKGHEGKLATVAIGEMIHLVVHDEYKGVLKVAEKPATVHPGTLGKAKLSTGGVTAPLPAAVKKTDDGHKH